MWSPSACWIGNGASSALGVARSPIDRASASAYDLGRQLGDGHGHEVGVGELGGPDEEGAAHRLGDAVQRPGRIAAVGLEVVPLEDVEHQADGHAAGGRRARAVDVEAAERGVDGRPDLGLVGFQVVPGDETAVLLHVSGDQLGGAAGVELVGPAGGDPLERRGQVGLDEPVAGMPGLAVGLAQRGDRLGIVAQPAGVAWERARRRDWSGSTRPSWRLSDPARSAEMGNPSRARPHGRPDELGPGAFPPSRVRQRQAADGPRHAGGPGTGPVAGARPSVGAEVHRRRGGPRRHLAEVDRDHFPALRQVGDEEAAPAQVAGLGERHGQGERRRDRGVHRIAAGAEHVAARLRRVAFLGDDRVLREGLAVRPARRRRDRSDGRADQDGPADPGCSLHGVHRGFRGWVAADRPRVVRGIGHHLNALPRRFPPSSCRSRRPRRMGIAIDRFRARR